MGCDAGVSIAISKRGEIKMGYQGSISRFFKRSSKGIALGLSVATLAAACGSTASSSSTSAATTSAGVVHLTFWSWVPGLQTSVNMWNSSHPNIQVKLDEVTSGAAGTYAKMFSALQAGNAPDLGQVEYPILPNFEQLVAL